MREVEIADRVKDSIANCRFRSSAGEIQAKKQLRGRKESSRAVADPASASATASASLLFDGGGRKRGQARAEENQGERKRSRFSCWLSILILLLSLSTKKYVVPTLPLDVAEVVSLAFCKFA